MGPSPGYTFEAVVKIPAATLAAVVTAAGGPSSFMESGVPMMVPRLIGADNAFGLFGEYQGDSWKWWEEMTSDPRDGAVATDTYVTLTYVVTPAGGTNWNAVFKIDGTTVYTDSAIDLLLTTSDPFNVLVGGVAPFGATGEIYYVSSVTVKNSSSATIFSDDFSSGDFSAWDSVVGSPSVAPGAAAITLNPRSPGSLSATTKSPGSLSVSTKSPGGLSASTKSPGSLTLTPN